MLLMGRDNYTAHSKKEESIPKLLAIHPLAFSSMVIQHHLIGILHPILLACQGCPWS